MTKLKTPLETVYFCNGKKCCRYNDEAKSYLKNLICTSGLEKNVSIEKMKCQGMCKSAPVVYIDSHKKYKKEVTRKKAEKLFDKYLAELIK